MNCTSNVPNRYTCRTFHPRATEYTFFSSTHDTFSRIDQVLDPNQRYANFKRLKLYEVSSPTTMVKYVEIKQHIPGNQWIKDKIKGKFKNILKQVSMKTQHIKTYEVGFPGSSVVKNQCASAGD